MTLIYMDLGTGPIKNSDRQSAILNMHQLMIDALPESQQVIEFRRNIEFDEGGRYGFDIAMNNAILIVQMPGWELERVRWRSPEDGRIIDFPRLYVDGSSWVWKYAVEIVQEWIRGEYDDGVE